MGHVRSKTRLDYMKRKKKKKAVHSRGYIISVILMKLSHNVCLNENLDEFENGRCRVKS